MLNMKLRYTYRNTSIFNGVRPEISYFVCKFSYNNYCYFQLIFNTEENQILSKRVYKIQ